VAATMRMRV